MRPQFSWDGFRKWAVLCEKLCINCKMTRDLLALMMQLFNNPDYSLYLLWANEILAGDVCMCDSLSNSAMSQILNLKLSCYL